MTGILLSRKGGVMKPTWKAGLEVRGRLADVFGPGDGGGFRLEPGAEELLIDEGCI